MSKELENKENEVTDNVEAIDEASAAETLKPAAMSVADPKSRVEIMKTMIGAMAEMPKRDLVKWFDQAQAQFGPGKDYGVGDNSAKNKASVAMKSSIKEDFEVMFEGQDLNSTIDARSIYCSAMAMTFDTDFQKLQSQVFWNDPLINLQDKLFKV